MVQLQSGQGQREPGESHQNGSDLQPPRSPTSSSLTSLSAERSQGSVGEAESSAEEEIPDQLNRHSSGDSKSYRAETPRRSVPRVFKLVS